MPKTSIFFYTHNLLPKELLRHTLSSAVKHAKINNCELILTSHFPLTNDYIDKKMFDSPFYADEIDPVTRKSSKSPLYDYLVKETILTSKEIEGVDIKSYVVGKLPYNITSIVKQIILSLDMCSGDNIIFMEHDCLYPDNYVKTVETSLTNFGKDLTYCLYNICYLNFEGYFVPVDPNGLWLLSFAGKKDLLRNIYERKLELSKSNKKIFLEPILSCHDSYVKSIEPRDMAVKNNICIDKFLGKDRPILNIKHKLNADGYTAGDKYFHDHLYWGNDKQYLDMMSEILGDNRILTKWNYGIAKLNY